MFRGLLLTVALAAALAACNPGTAPSPSIVPPIDSSPTASESPTDLGSPTASESPMGLESASPSP